MNEPRARILVVDDEEPNRRLLVEILNANGHTATAVSGVSEAKAMLAKQPVELVLTDMTMPGETGLDLVRYVNLAYPDIATVMVTASDDAELAQSVIWSGCYGYVTKPFSASEITINVLNALRRRELEIDNRRHRHRLEAMVKERTKELWGALSDLERSREEVKLAQEETVHRLALAAEFRDDETSRHIDRMSRYCELLAAQVGWTGEKATLIRLASVMHDIGKIGIPDSILRKPGKLNDLEYRHMQKHPMFGFKILANSNSDLMTTAASIALTHHEKMDGTGYPQGLPAERIPQAGRIAAIADVFDAITTDRVYRKALPLHQAIGIMKQGRGTQFDPELLDIFLSSMDHALRIKEEAEENAQVVRLDA
jgi:putative two-component system response regulator